MELAYILSHVSSHLLIEVQHGHNTKQAVQDLLFECAQKAQEVLTEEVNQLTPFGPEPQTQLIRVAQARDQANFLRDAASLFALVDAELLTRSEGD